MKPTCCLALVTAPDREVALRLAQAALGGKLVACANLVPGIESHYWWQGVLETSQEVLIIFKTMRSRLEELENLIIEHHPYETPEFIVVPLEAGNANYLQWIADSVTNPSS